MSDVELREGMVFDINKEGKLAVDTWLYRQGWLSKILISNK